MHLLKESCKKCIDIQESHKNCIILQESRKKYTVKTEMVDLHENQVNLPAARMYFSLTCNYLRYMYKHPLLPPYKKQGNHRKS